MCGRYYIDDTFQKGLLSDFPSFREQAAVMHIPSGDVRPTDAAPVIMADRLAQRSDMSLTEAHWGFQEDFNSGKKLLINARAETADTRPAFSYAIRSRRCVIPVSGFYEYTPDKEKVSFFRKEEQVIYLAGCARWSEGWCFVILTTSPNDDVKKVHDRMPVMLHKEDVRKWVCSRRIPTALTDGWKPSLESFRRYEQLSLF